MDRVDLVDLLIGILMAERVGGVAITGPYNNLWLVVLSFNCRELIKHGGIGRFGDHDT